MTLLCLTGCDVKNINDLSVDELLSIAINEEIDLNNMYNKGYKFYIPKGYKIYENNLYNQILISNGNKYYLNIDIVSYINEETPYHNIIEDSYYYKSFSNNGKDGFIEIIENNSYFFIEIMYNYAIIETAVKENDINYAVINILNILNSIKYNKTVISNEVGKSTFFHKETLYEIEKPKVQIDDKNFLDFIEEYDKYVEPKNSVKDEDKITN